MLLLCTHCCYSYDIMHRSWCGIKRTKGLSMLFLVLPLRSSFNVAVMGHDTARRCGKLYKAVCVCVCAWVMEAVSGSVVKELNTCAVKWQLTE